MKCEAHESPRHGCDACRPALEAAAARVAAKTGSHVRIGGTRPAAAVKPRTPKPVVRQLTLICPYEGPVVEPCRSCNKVLAEDRSVRLCAHPNPTDPDREKCHRVAIAGSPHQVCDTCVDHPKNAAKPAPPPAESPKPALEPPPGRVKPTHGADPGPKRIPDRPGGRPR